MNDEIDNTNEKLTQEGNPNWYKGMESANPDGRPKGSKNYLTLLEDALEKEAKKAGITYWEKLAQYCYRNPMTATAILKKFLPDKQQTELITPEPIEIVIHKSNES